MSTQPAAIVVRFDADWDGVATAHVMKSLGVVLPVGTQVWMCIGDSLDALNVTLAALGWAMPPREQATSATEPPERPHGQAQP